MSGADLVLAALVGLGGGVGAWLGIRGRIARPAPLAVASGLIGAAAYLALRPVLFGG